MSRSKTVIMFSAHWDGMLTTSLILCCRLPLPQDHAHKTILDVENDQPPAVRMNVRNCSTLFRLCCLVTPCLSMSIQCHVWPYSFLCLQITRSDIRWHIQNAVSLVIADGHFIRSLSGYLWVNILTLSHLRSTS